MNPDFRDMLCALNAEGVEYLLVGAYAMAVHGYPRATGDMDVWIRPTRENAERVWRALERFGAPLEQVSIDDFVSVGTVFQIGVAPRRIDILTAISAVEFGEAWSERRSVEVDEVPIPVIGRTQLLRNKRATGRPKDAGDVAWLEGEGDLSID